MALTAGRKIKIIDIETLQDNLNIILNLVEEVKILGSDDAAKRRFGRNACLMKLKGKNAQKQSFYYKMKNTKKAEKFFLSI